MKYGRIAGSDSINAAIYPASVSPPKRTPELSPGSLRSSLTIKTRLCTHSVN